MKITRGLILATPLWILSLFGLFLYFQSPDSIVVSDTSLSLTANLLGILLLAILGGIAFFSGIMTPMALLLYFFETGNKREYQLNTTAFPEHDSTGQAWEDELLANGFRYLGSYEAVHRGNKADVINSFVYIEESQTIYAEIAYLGNGKHFMAFISDYPDGFSYQTNHKHPNMVEEIAEWVVIQSVTSSVTAAYDYHAAQAERYNQAHGKAKKIFAVADALTNDSEKRARVRSVNFSYFQRYGLAALIFLPLATLVYYLNFDGLKLGDALNLSLNAFLLGSIVVGWNYLQSNLFRNRTVEQRKPRKVAE